MFLINAHLTVLKLNPPKFSAIKAHQTSAGGVEQTQKQGNTVADGSTTEQPAEPGNNRRDTPLGTG